MADSGGRDETGSSSGKTRVKDSKLEDHNQQPAAINTPTASSEEGEEEAREHQEAEPTVQETNRESCEVEEDAKGDAAAGEEKEEINEDAEDPLMHGEMIKKRKTDHEDGSGVVTLTVVGGDLPGAQTGKAAMPMMMGCSGSEAGLGGGVSESAAADWRSMPRPAYKYTYSVRMPATGQAVGTQRIRRRYEFERAAAATSLDDNAAAANRGAEEPPPGPAGQDEGGGHEDEEEDEDEVEEDEDEK